jgi:hypothetical protein
VRNSLFRVVDVEKPYAIAAAALAHCLDEGFSGRIGGVVAAGPGRHSVILHGEGKIGPVHGTLLLGEPREGVMGVQFMQHVTVDIDEIAAVGALPDAMKIPDFIEQRSCQDANL